MEIFFDGDALEKMERVLNSFGARGKAAVGRALNRALAGVKTDASKHVRQDYPGVKAATVKKSFTVAKANQSALIGTARSKGARQPLILFGARPSKPGSKRPPVGASVRISASRKKIPGAFAARMPSGHLGLFKRTGAFNSGGVEKIRELFTFAVPEALEWIEENQGAVSEGARDRFVKALDHEMDRAMNELGAKF